jgi:hypothetical protein
MPYFFRNFFLLQGQTKNSTRGCKTIKHDFATPGRTFFLNGSKLPSFRLISNDTLYFIYKFELRCQGGNIEHFQSFKKAGETLKKLQG